MLDRNTNHFILQLTFWSLVSPRAFISKKEKGAILKIKSVFYQCTYTAQAAISMYKSSHKQASRVPSSHHTIDLLTAHACVENTGRIREVCVVTLKDVEKSNQMILPSNRNWRQKQKSKLLLDLSQHA